MRPTDHLARFGGEEFAVILPETGPRAAEGVAERLRTAVKLAPIKDANNKLLPSVTISIGGAVLSSTNATAKALLGSADANLYASKQNGRDRVTM